MKRLMVIILMGLMISCQEAPVTKTDLFVFLDYTEGQQYQLQEDLDEYLALMNIGDDQTRNYGEIRIIPIYDIASSVSLSAELKIGKSKLEGNKYLRQQEVDRFKAEIQQILEKINDNHQGEALNSSHIFQPICKGMAKLEQSDADRKVMLIYSDMLENSPLANFHSSEIEFSQLKSSFDAHWNVRNMSGLELYIVYPIDKRNDGKIRRASEFWHQYLLEKGLAEGDFHFDTAIDL